MRRFKRRLFFDLKSTSVFLPSLWITSENKAYDSNVTLRSAALAFKMACPTGLWHFLSCCSRMCTRNNTTLWPFGAEHVADVSFLQHRNFRKVGRKGLASGSRPEIQRRESVRLKEETESIFDINGKNKQAWERNRIWPTSEKRKTAGC